MRRDVPFRRSLLMRLLAVSVLVSVCSIAATAWLTVRSTTVAIQQEQGQALADDARTYDALLGYAATHPDWDGARQVVGDLARKLKHRITLTTEDRTPILDSDTGPISLPAKPTAVIDPLSVDGALVADAPADHIDPRAVGPYRLTRAERDTLRAAAQRRAACLRDAFFAVTTKIVEDPNGRPRVETSDHGLDLSSRCPAPVLDAPSRTEAKALTRLGELVHTCLAHQGRPDVKLALDFSWTPMPAPASATTSRQTAPRQDSAKDRKVVQDCVTSGRREQLASYVAPTALMFVSSRSSAPSTIFDLSRANQTRIAGVAAGVLLITVTVTILAGIRLIGPLRALTGAARRMEEGDISARVDVDRGDEIGRLATAFNAMSERREQLEKLRRAMVSDVAHELRTPLSNIRGWLEAAEDGVVDPDRTLTASLLEEAMLLQHVIDDLQDLAMADAGELRLHKEPIGVPDLVAQVVTAHRGGADAAGVTLTSQAQGRPEILADPLRLRQAVGNLVSNAVRHTPPGGSVTVRSRLEGGHVVIDVEDTGSGIAAEDLAHVFERFWRADKSRNRATGGSGLGLSIVRKLAEAHGGTVSATSEPGRGSVFTLRLPA
ncbi:sensor histidine kinase [Planotetraspora kaengkrachanensis]|uniref:histidine kinase n=1 Tax=Planotetraspora kaengkrachanensis TaxID=575193 RepID=A0A8J3VAY3_9ACTN|nr:HAMP domain-containing sensor histidine kinase [Planotetraspora kaengkrachanensis]GIG83606.1 two-component sensor histidine kinase [Planotetraspora kaengkrachanensis]